MSNSTSKLVRRVDVPAASSGGGAIIPPGGSGPTGAGPGIAVPGAPQNVSIVSTFLLFSAVTPSAGANVAWTAPVGAQQPDSYNVQWATDSGFTNPTTKVAGRGQLTMGLDGMPVATTIYVRVQARIAGVYGAWSATASAATPSDTTPPAAPTALVTSWNGATGDLLLSWTNPTSTNFRDVRVRVYASNGGALLTEAYVAGGSYLWTRSLNALATSGAYDPSIYLVLTARSWGGVFSATDLTGTATLAVPATPSGLTSTWASDTGTAGAACVITWTASGLVERYRLTIDGVARDVLGGRFAYELETNRAEHAGNADPVLSLSLVAVDALGQSSTAATATATNAAPPTTTITAFGAFDKVGLTIGASSAADILDYRVRVYKAAALVRTVFFTDLRPLYAIEDGDGSYTFDVSARDVFGQIGTASAQTAAQSLTDPAQFVADLRAGVVYRDSVSTTPSTLAGLKNDDLATNVVTYAASAAAWRWTEAVRPLDTRHRKAALATSASASYYYGVSEDGVAYTWYAGGTATGGVWSPVAQASEAAAQTAATTLAAGTWLITLPATVEVRFFRLGHRNTTTSYALREFYPRSLVEADDIRVQNLAGISADLGSITAGSLSAVTITGATITGGVVQTAASGARVAMDSSGLKTYDSAGNVVIEATTATNGELRAGSGRIRLTRTTGIVHVNPAPTITEKVITMYRDDGTTEIGYLSSELTGSAGNRLRLVASATPNADLIELSANQVEVTSNLTAGGYLTVGGASAVGAGLGEIRASATISTISGLDAFNAVRDRRVGLTFDATNDAGYLYAIQDGIAYKELRIQTVGGNLRIGSTGAAMGFLGATPITRPAVSGSRGGNAALASALAALAALGLVTDSTTA